MTRTAGTGREAGPALPAAIDAVFGRWPAWPWSVLALIAAGGVVGFAAAPVLARIGRANPTAFGPAACAGYGIVAAALLALLPRAGRLLALRTGASRRPSSVEASWWPLELLAAALKSTPSLRRTPEEFATAVAAAGGQARSILAHRLWPAWVTAFVAPVLGLLTAWQVGAQVIRRLGDTGPEQVYPAFVAQVSPPMVGTIAAGLILMIVLVVIDQWTKGLLQRWCGIVELADGEHPAVVERLGGEDFRAGTATRVEPARMPGPEPAAERDGLPKHPLDPDQLQQMWQQSTGRNE